jgi:hypothetical protein
MSWSNRILRSSLCVLALAVAGCAAGEEESPPPVTTVIPGEQGEREDDSEIADTDDDGREAEDSDHDRGKAGKKDKEKKWKGTEGRTTNP